MSRLYGISGLILAGVLATGLWGCGSASISDSTTSVTVTLQVPASSKERLGPLQSVPIGVASIRLVVTGEGMDALVDTFDVTPGEIVTRTLDIPSGSGRVFTVTAYNNTGIALYRGRSDPVDLEPNVPTDVAIPMEVLLVSIAVTPPSPVVGLGAIQPFTATGTYGDGTTEDLTNSVTWTSLDEAVATISTAGLAATLSVGTTTITATDSASGISDSATLTVISAQLVSIAVTPINPTVASGLTQQFTATGTYTNSSTQDLTASVEWSSSATGVATISTAGLAATLSVGTTTITATDPVTDISGSTILTVTVAQLVSIAVTPLDPSIAAGLTQPFTATGTYTDSSIQDLTASVEWSSSATGVATISSTGLATGLAGGTTTITAASGSISGSTTLSVTPVLNRLSLVSGIIGNTLKMTGSGFGSAQGTGTVSIGGVNAATILRWTSTEIAAVIPSGVTVSAAGTSNSVMATVGGQPSNLMSVTLFDHTHGIGGENDEGNVDKLVLNVATPSVTVTNVSDVSGVDETSSIVLSGDGNTVIEANSFVNTDRIRSFDTSPTMDEVFLSPTRDAAISRNGTTVLLANGTTNTLTLFPGNFTAASPTPTSITGPAGVCFYEVALTSNGNTAAAVGRVTAFSPCDGAYNVYRIDNVLGTPTFTLLSTAGSGASYTDVAISEDGNTVIAGRIGLVGSTYQAGVHRIRNFTTSPVLETGQAPMTTDIASCPFDTVDVDLSADGMTAIVGIVSLTCGNHGVFQIRNADLSSAISAAMPTPTNLQGVAIHSGGSIALVRDIVFSTPFTRLIRFDGFNLASPTSTNLTSTDLSVFNTTSSSRKQDQIDLQ